MSRRWERDLDVSLTDAEVAVRAKELSAKCLKAAGLEAQIDEVKGQAKDDVKMLKEHLDGIRGRVRELARCVRKGVARVPVMVEAQVVDSQVNIVRLDTGAVVETRALTEDDRQMEIDEVLRRIEADTKEAPAPEPDDDEEEEDDTE